MRILFVGPVLPGSTTLQRLLALRRLGHRVTEVQTTGLAENLSVARRFLLHLGFPVDRVRANARWLAMGQRDGFDVVWCDQACTLSVRTLLSLRRLFPDAIFVSYSPDDMPMGLNASHRFKQTLPLFDVHFTTTQHNHDALRGWGARRVELVQHGYAPETRRSMPGIPVEHAGQRVGLAAAGQKGCQASGDSNDELLERMLGIVRTLADARSASAPAGSAPQASPAVQVGPSDHPVGAMGSPVEKHYPIIFMGNDWWGSDARAVGAAFRRAGCYLLEVQDQDYVPQSWSSWPLKLVRRLLQSLMAANYNATIIKQAGALPMAFALVFKGRWIQPDTIRALKALGLPVYCVYPDVSFFDHGGAIEKDLPLYDCVFTTKPFHLRDANIIHRTRELRLVSHGYDPEVHRPVCLSPALHAAYACDVSFVGCWSAKKEAQLRRIVDGCAGARLRIWGPGWGRADAPVRQCWAGRGAYGDELAIIHAASKINLGLLSEAGTHTAEGDRTTARSWQIPACGGFMLHEYTDEIAQAFDVETEIATFRSLDDLTQQVGRFLADDPERERRRLAALRRCRESAYTYDPMVAEILRYHESWVPQI
jgi:hypothetical protein